MHSALTGLGGRVADVLAARRWLLAALVAIDALPQIAIEFAPGDWDRASLLLGLVTLYLQLVATFAALATLGCAPPGWSRHRPTLGRYPSAFLLSLLSVSAILLGFALVLPGLLLASLWSVALPALAAEELGAVAAMRRSWRLVRPHMVAILALTAGWLAVYLLPLGAVFVVEYHELASPWPYVAINLVLSSLLMVGCVLWASIYVLLRAQEEMGT